MKALMTTHDFKYKILPIVVCLCVPFLVIDINIFFEPGAFRKNDFVTFGLLFSPAIATAFYVYILADRSTKSNFDPSEGPRTAADAPKKTKSLTFWIYSYGFVVIAGALIYTQLIMTGA